MTEAEGIRREEKALSEVGAMGGGDEGGGDVVEGDEEAKAGRGEEEEGDWVESHWEETEHPLEPMICTKAGDQWRCLTTGSWATPIRPTLNRRDLPWD